jgi:hypothetical protein
MNPSQKWPVSARRCCIINGSDAENVEAVISEDDAEAINKTLF